MLRTLRTSQLARSGFGTPSFGLRFNSVGRAFVFSQTGEPKDVIQVLEYPIEKPLENQVLLKSLGFTINPADINQLEGVYPSVPPKSVQINNEDAAIGGNEGLFQVLDPGAKSGLKKGDWVLPRKTCFGTWRSHALVEADTVVKIDNTDLTKVQATTVSVNPSTAYEMLKDLKEGDWFIQNGGNSGVGRAAIQIGHILGLKSISVVRDRPDLEVLKKELTDLGATHVITEEEASDKLFSKQIKSWTGGKIKLALNCIGGKSATSIMRQLGAGGSIVTYGGMSKKPLTFPTGPFIFKDITAKGYWLTRWADKHPEEKAKTIENIFKFYREKKFVAPPVNISTLDFSKGNDVVLSEFLDALGKAQKGGGKKQLVQWVEY